MNCLSVFGQAPDPLRSLSLLCVLMYVIMIFTGQIVLGFFFLKQTGKPYMICDSAVCKMYVSSQLKWKNSEINVTLKKHYAKQKGELFCILEVHLTNY